MSNPFKTYQGNRSGLKITQTADMLVPIIYGRKRMSKWLKWVMVALAFVWTMLICLCIGLSAQAETHKKAQSKHVCNGHSLTDDNGWDQCYAGWYHVYCGYHDKASWMKAGRPMWCIELHTWDLKGFDNDPSHYNVDEKGIETLKPEYDHPKSLKMEYGNTKSGDWLVSDPKVARPTCHLECNPDQLTIHNAGGSQSCADFPPLFARCATGQYLAAMYVLDDKLYPECREITKNMVCDASQYSTGIDTNGNAICSPTIQFELPKVTSPITSPSGSCLTTDYAGKLIFYPCGPQ